MWTVTISPKSICAPSKPPWRRSGSRWKKTHWIMDKWGYTGSACIPMALDDAIAQGKGPTPGSLVLFCASGGGIALATSLWRWR